MTLVRVMLARFLRCSGSGVSILNACRHEVPLALSLRETSIPSRTTQESTRPPASDRPMCCQPGNRHGFASFRNRSTSSLLNKDATQMEACKIRGTTQRLVSRTGPRRQGNIFSFQSREKNVLDVSSYRPGVSTSVRFSFAFFRVNECQPRCYNSWPTLDVQKKWAG